MVKVRDIVPNLINVKFKLHLPLDGVDSVSGETNRSVSTSK